MPWRPSRSIGRRSFVFKKAADAHFKPINQSRLAAQARWRKAVVWFRKEFHAGTLACSYVASDGSQVTLEPRIFGTDDCEDLFRSGEFEGCELLVEEAALDAALPKSKGTWAGAGSEESMHPQAVEPDPADFDPMRLSRWTMPMAAAWIGRRNIEAVREQWNDWRELCSDPQKNANGEWFQARRRPASLLRVSHPNPADPDGDWLLTWYTFRQALKDGDVVAAGTDIQTGIPVEIPPMHWQRLDDFPDFPDVEPNFRFPRSQPQAGYDDVTVKRDDILRIWPARPGEDTVGVSRIASSRKIKAVLEAIDALSRERLAGLPAKDRNKLIRDWLAKSGPPITVSDRTINRAMGDSRPG